MEKTKIRLVLAEERKIGNTICRVYRPELTEEQRKQRMKKVYRAVAACLREM